ncbi:MAG: nucleoside 2-deoxyribosyltransferase [Candidatus Marsarchaeota archaeon]|nr:nucleoside 2-deoxyribosyltransferase [Candidatus Marsarchaeota archaeon]
MAHKMGHKEATLLIPGNMTEPAAKTISAHVNAIEKDFASAYLRASFAATESVEADAERREKTKRLIKNSDEFHILLDMNDPDTLFYLGVAFAYGKKIMPIGEIDRTPKKSFQNVIIDISREFEKSGLLKTPVNYGNRWTAGTRAYICCPVRDADKEQVAFLKGLALGMRFGEMNVHYPAENTDQIDDRGIDICRQNGYAIKEADMVFLVYDPTSKGTRFDLGIAFALDKPLTLVNVDQVIAAEKNGDRFASFLLNWAQPTLKDTLKLQEASKVVKRK